MAETMDFIGFTYNGKHSFNDFGIYRTSEGSRYNDNLVPSMTDKTVDIPGGDGQYYFYTTHKNRQFSIPIAFDGLTEIKYREMRQWLDGKAIHDLIFDEAPYKVYSAKVTGTPSLKTLCFEKEGKRIYKGEGTIQFTCYYPYAHTPNMSSVVSKSLLTAKNFPCGLMLFKGQTIHDFNNRSLTFNFTAIDCDGNVISSNTKFGNSSNKYTATQDMYITEIYVPTGTAATTCIVHISTGEYYAATISGGFEVYRPNTSTALPRNGRNINHYHIADYPNKAEWAFTSGLTNAVVGDNAGDIPAYFTIEASGTIPVNTNFKIGDKMISTRQECSLFKWDSRTGLVTGKVTGNTNITPIEYTGDSLATIPVGGIEQDKITLQNGTLKYNYWYY